MRSDVHIYLFNISIESTPNLDLVAGRGEETKSIFDIPATNYCVLVSSYWVVVLVVVIEPDRLSSEDQSQHLF